MKRMALMLAALVLLLCGCTVQDDRRTSSLAARETRAAVQEIDYTPEKVAALQSATLTWTLPREDRAMVHAGALTDAAGLRALEGLLRSATPSEPAGEFSGEVCHELTLTCQDGAVIRLDVAMDNSCVLRAGECYYAFTPDEPEKGADELYALFGAEESII